MGLLSKAWKGVKGAVKKVAATVKKVAKKVAYAIPGGKQLWDLGSKVGKGIMKGIGKITSKLGPVGTMALSFVLAPVMGPALGAMWSGFGAGASAMAASANAFVSTLGTVGQGIFATGNFIGGTLGALGNAVTEGASNIMAGNFSGAVSSFATNVSNAFTGKAGMAAVNSAAAQAASSAAANVASGDSWFAAGDAAGKAAQVANLNTMGVEAVQNLQGLGTLGADAIAQMDPETLAKFSPEAQMVQNNVKAMTMSSPVGGVDLKGQFTPDALKPTLSNPTSTYGSSMAQAWQVGATDAGVIRNTANNIMVGNTAFTSMPAVTNGSTLDNVVARASQAQSLLGGGSGGESGYQPYVAKAINSAQIANPMRASGQGSAGYSLLGGVQGLEESIRRSQAMMFG